MSKSYKGELLAPPSPSSGFKTSNEFPQVPKSNKQMVHILGVPNTKGSIKSGTKFNIVDN